MPINQHALLVFRRHRKECEHHQEDEDVVHRQRLFDEVTGDELHRLRVGLFIAVETAEVPPQPADEQERHQHPDQRPDAGLFHVNAVRALLVQREEVDRQRGDHEQGENSHSSGVPTDIIFSIAPDWRIDKNFLFDVLEYRDAVFARQWIFLW